MNAVEKLLKMDAGKIKMPEKIVAMKLAKLGGEEFEFPCVAINPERYSEIQQSVYDFNKKGDVKVNGLGKVPSMTIVEGCPSVFKSKEVMEHFGIHTPLDLINKLLLSGEKDDLYKAIIELNGYEDDEDEIKN